MLTSGNAYVESWGQDPTHGTLNSVRVGGLGATSLGRELRVEVMGNDGRSVLDTVTWQINALVSPDLNLHAPLAFNAVGAILIAIE